MRQLFITVFLILFILVQNTFAKLIWYNIPELTFSADVIVSGIIKDTESAPSILVKKFLKGNGPDTITFKYIRDFEAITPSFVSGEKKILFLLEKDGQYRLVGYGDNGIWPCSDQNKSKWRQNFPKFVNEAEIQDMESVVRKLVSFYEVKIGVQRIREVKKLLSSGNENLIYFALTLINNGQLGLKRPATIGIRGDKKLYHGITRDIILKKLFIDCVRKLNYCEPQGVRSGH